MWDECRTRCDATSLDQLLWKSVLVLQNLTVLSSWNKVNGFIFQEKKRVEKKCKKNMKGWEREKTNEPSICWHVEKEVRKRSWVMDLQLKRWNSQSRISFQPKCLHHWRQKTIITEISGGLGYLEGQQQESRRQADKRVLIPNRIWQRNYWTHLKYFWKYSQVKVSWMFWPKWLKWNLGSKESQNTHSKYVMHLKLNYAWNILKTGAIGVSNIFYSVLCKMRRPSWSYTDFELCKQKAPEIYIP